MGQRLADMGKGVPARLVVSFRDVQNVELGLCRNADPQRVNEGVHAQLGKIRRVRH